MLVNPKRVHEFAVSTAFDEWLGAHHNNEPEVWIKVHKVGSGLPSITPKEAIEVALCWGWIDGIRKSFNEQSFLQRYTPRRSRSTWSRINVETVGRLVANGSMTEHGMRTIEAAKADGRWDRAYGSGKGMAMPDDLQAAIDADDEDKPRSPG